MIVGIGIDIVEIERFVHFADYSNARLERIFSATEINYCLSNPLKSAERFAVRFAAKEALYKALTHAQHKPPCPFLTFCSCIEIVLLPYPAYRIHHNDYFAFTSFLLTMSHTQHTAVAHAIVLAN